MSTNKPKSRDISPSFKGNILFKLQPASVTSTKISIKPKIINNITIERPKSRDKSPTDIRKEYSASIKMKNKPSLSISNEKSTSKDKSSSIISSSTNISKKSSLLMKYEIMKNSKKSNSLISPVKLTTKSNMNITRNNLKELSKTDNQTPKSTISSISEASNKRSISKSKEKDENTNKFNSPISRVNKFATKNHSVQGKIDFREMNTSPLLLNKNKKITKEKEKIKTPTKELKIATTTIKPKSLIKNFIQSKESGEESKHVNVKTQIKVEIKKEKETMSKTSHIDINSNINLLETTIKEQNKMNFTKKYINKVYEISRIGYAPGTKKYNQDNYFIFENFLNNPDFLFLAVCDGHGVNGHDVSKYLRENLPTTVNSLWLDKIKNKKRELNKEEYMRLLELSFAKINNCIVNELSSDTTFSGSTCVSLIYNIDSLICANAGDSRCTIGRLINNEWKSHDISRDHKPNDKDEMERILSSGGRIEPYYDEKGEQAGPFRVWLKEYDYPGLAMSRSFGDEIAASVGVTAIPEIIEWKLTKEDKFIILASDGLWEFMESNEVVNIVKDYYLSNDIQAAADFLVKESSKRWIKEESSIDDITIIIIFFEDN